MSTKEAFDRIYETNGWGGGSGPGSQPAAALDLIDALNTYSNPKGSFLDIGCGDGRIASRLTAWHYLGVDVSERAIVEFQKNTRRPCVCMDAADGKWRFDYVLIKDVLQHLPREHCQRLLRAVEACETVLVVNDVPGVGCPEECQTGGYRPIDPVALDPRFRKVREFEVAGFRKGLWERKVWSRPAGQQST